MTFGTRSLDNLQTVMRAGASLDMGAGARSLTDLTSLAVVANSSGVKLTLRGMSARSMEDLIKIAVAGGNAVTFAD